MVAASHGHELKRGDKKVDAIFEAVRRYGAITREEAVCRVGEEAANLAISRLVAARLLVNLTEHANTPAEEVFGLSDRAETRLSDGISAKRLVALALEERTSHLPEYRGSIQRSARFTKPQR